jgi:putative acetyltransferase
MKGTAAAAENRFVFDIQPVRADAPGIGALLAELDDYLYQQYPVSEFGRDITHILSEAELLDPAVTLLAVRAASVDARSAAEARHTVQPWLGCAALRRTTDHAGPYAEIKRVYLRPSARGRGAGRALVLQLLARAQAEGIARVLLETGTRQPEAQALFTSCGFTVCGRFGDYEENPVSVYMERQL